MSSDVVSPAMEEVVRVVEATLAGTRGAWDDIRVAGVRADGDFLLIAFRYRRDPSVYGVHLRRPDALLTSPWTGVQVDDLQQWAWDAGGWLGEEVGTGLTRHAPRRERDGIILLSVQADAPEVRPPGFFVGRVPVSDASGFRVGRPGAHLKSAGLHVRLPRRLLAQRRLVAWAQAYVDNAAGEPFVGHAVVSGRGEDGGDVVLDLVETAGGNVPASLAGALGYHALHDAVDDAGAVTARSHLTEPLLRELGFDHAAPPGIGTGWSLRLAGLRVPTDFLHRD